MGQIARAAIFHAPRQRMTIETVSVRDPAPDEVLVELRAAGLCHIDLHILDGHNPMPAPLVLGHESCGVVVACGAEVRDLATGDLVIPYVMPECGACFLCSDRRTNACITTGAVIEDANDRFTQNGKSIAAFLGLGTFSEYIVVKASRAAKIRADIAPEVASYISCGAATGLGAVLFAARVAAGDTVAVFGLGGIGLNVIQGARMAGASRIIGVDVNPDREAVARRYGATDFIDPKAVDNASLKIQELTGLGVDHAFDCVGSPAVLGQAFEATNPLWGECHNIGIAAAGATFAFDPHLFRTGGRKIGGVMMGNAKAKTDLPKIVDWELEGKIDLQGLISHRIRLDEINEGFDLLRAGKATRIVIDFA